ncbi:MAG: hypothetical protein Q8S19_04620 [Bacillota bacterium]|nr:hypothetical protein [Bacillota bacterium]
MRIPVVSFTPQTQQVRNSIELQPGTIYRGTVVGINSDSIIIRIGGMLIRSTVQLALELGQVLDLRAEQADESTLLLRVVPVEDTPSTPVSLEQGLKQLHLQPTPQNMAAVKALLAWLQPIASDEVARLVAESKDLPPEKQSAYLNVRGWTKAAELPEDKTTIKVITRFLLGLAEPEEIPPALRHLNDASKPTNYPEVNILWWQNATQHGEFYVFNDNDSLQVDYAQFHTVALRIQTVHLGELWLRLGYTESHLSLAFYSPDDDVLQTLQSVEVSLKSVINACGYRLSGVSYRLEQPSSFLDVMPPVTEPYRGVNLVV